MNCNTARTTGSNVPDRRLPGLLACIGIRAFNILGGLCSPDSPNEKSYDDLLAFLIQHYSKATTKSLARQKLAEAPQHVNSIEVYN